MTSQTQSVCTVSTSFPRTDSFSTASGAQNGSVACACLHMKSSVQLLTALHVAMHARSVVSICVDNSPVLSNLWVARITCVLYVLSRQLTFDIQTRGLMRSGRMEPRVPKTEDIPAMRWLPPGSSSHCMILIGLNAIWDFYGQVLIETHGTGLSTTTRKLVVQKIRHHLRCSTLPRSLQADHHLADRRGILTQRFLTLRHCGKKFFHYLKAYRSQFRSTSHRTRFTMDLQHCESYTQSLHSLTIASTTIQWLSFRSLQLLQVQSLVHTFVVILDSVLTTKTFGQGDILTATLHVFTMMALGMQETASFYVGVSVELKTLVDQTALVVQPLCRLAVIPFRPANLVELWQIYDASFAWNSSAQTICSGRIIHVQALAAQTQSLEGSPTTSTRACQLPETTHLTCGGNKHRAQDHLSAMEAETSKRAAIEASTFFVGTGRILHCVKATLDFLPRVSLAIVFLAFVLYGVADTSQSTPKQLT